MTRKALLGLVMGILVPTGLAVAGGHSTVEVLVTRDATSGAVISAYGTLSDAYSSADSNQFIGCGGGADFGWCQAHDSSDDPDGTGLAYCFTVDPDLETQIRSIAPNSFVKFEIGDDGSCTTISVSHNSFYAMPH